MSAALAYSDAPAGDRGRPAPGPSSGASGRNTGYGVVEGNGVSGDISDGAEADGAIADDDARRGSGDTHESGGDESGSARFILRERTTSQHEATEAAFASYDLTRPRHYRAFLTAHAVALPGLEIAVTGRGWSGFKPRLPLLADDLAALRTWLPTPLIASELTDAGVWGTQYVLEGSKLGGRVLARNLPDGTPASYLTPGPSMGADWQAFCAAFDQAAADATIDWLDEATSAAIETFQHFRRAASALSEDLA